MTGSLALLSTSQHPSQTTIKCTVNFLGLAVLTAAVAAVAASPPRVALVAILVARLATAWPWTARLQREH